MNYLKKGKNDGKIYRLETSQEEWQMLTNEQSLSEMGRKSSSEESFCIKVYV